ncbi:hypothetical protein [Streptomyces canus]|uniref:hypothetical protein n=1 Tax=Streptomyces canus TaxID=58343 RepID=UPI00324C81D0
MVEMTEKFVRGRKEGLEDFYGRLGWREAGRWPSALRFAPDDTRDEVLMLLAPPLADNL